MTCVMASDNQCDQMLDFKVPQYPPPESYQKSSHISDVFKIAK